MRYPSFISSFQQGRINISNFFLVLIVLSQLKFFEFYLLNERFLNVLAKYVVLIIIVFGGLGYLLFLQKSKFKLVFILFPIASILSFVGALEIWGQPFQMSLNSYLPYFSFLIYFYLRGTRMSTKILLDLILILGISHCFFNLINIFVSANIFGFQEALETYSVIKTRFPGRVFMYISYFILLEKLFYKKNLVILIVILTYLLSFLLMGRRVMLVSIIFSSLFAYKYYKGVQLKSLFILLIILLGSYFTVATLFSDYITELIASSEKQANQGEDYIRIKSAAFYTTIFHKNPISYIIGNGPPNFEHFYGKQVRYFQDRFHFYMADIGLIGHYTKFGILGVAIPIILLFRFWKTKKLNSVVFKCISMFFIPMALLNLELTEPETFMAFSMMIYIYEQEKLSQCQLKS